MKAFDLEDQIFGRALIRKALESEASERTALINRLTDPRIKALHEELGFTANGTKNDNFARPAWQEKIVDRYVETAFINDQEVQNATVGFALEFRRKAAEIENPFDILKDRGLTTVIQRALGLPEEISKLDIDRQAALVGQKLDIATLKDPEVVERLVRKYVILSDALDPGIASQNAAVRMLSATASQSTAPIALDLSAITRVPSTPYR
jgi:hypothetical protein